METRVFPEKRIVLWSHPRSVSTAFELVFEERPDTSVVHEPCARMRHRKPLQRACPDPESKTREGARKKAFRQLLGPHDQPILFVKDMAYYLREKYYAVLLPKLTNTFIIRDPAATLVSHFKKDPKFTFEEAGYAAVDSMHEYVTKTLQQPSIIIDGNEFRQHPASIIRKYCEAIGISFLPDTLHWQPGNVRGWEIWARQGWHGEAERSSGVIPPPRQPIDTSTLPRRVQNMLPACRRMYEKLFELRLQPDASLPEDADAIE